MSEIEFSRQQKQAIVDELQKYFENELDAELGQFDGEFLLDFICKEIGPAFYNKGVADAQLVIEKKMLDVSDELYDIAKESKY
ncbi:DUF2164 domain-containing protein [Vibrio sp. SCSIO 43135]|uniref:DUF2164 domain-containing protein n=1 Tax=Vibrio paucivorans TaxID=2829489 RepID=A0A9X3CIW9_9VIBR|nr:MULTISPECIES: DUF2164 domain-containing protein [Vibrio]MCW8336664.1 DUF2164 domain-containing protein [Vibrio paucivorans]USD43984.1 DUF2164 domain-containing protein [Vibrio sp. SCSIO 43135]